MVFAGNTSYTVPHAQELDLLESCLSSTTIPLLTASTATCPVGSSEQIRGEMFSSATACRFTTWPRSPRLCATSTSAPL